MGVKSSPSATSSLKPEVGEIDTSAPFASVRAAVSLFGEGIAVSPDRPAAVKKSRRLSIESVLAEETQLHLAEKDRKKLKEQLENAEVTKKQALDELGVMKKILVELTENLYLVTMSKELAVKATENARIEAKELESGAPSVHSENDGRSHEESDKAREQYTIIVNELNVAKQELRNIKQDFEASLLAKVNAFKRADEADLATEASKVKINELSKEIASVQESVEHLKIAFLQTQEEQGKILSDKEVHIKTSKLALEEINNKVGILNGEYNPEMAMNLEEKLININAEINALQREVQIVKLADLESFKSVSIELDGAKEALLKVAEEEASLRSLEESLKLEIESVMQEHADLKQMETEAETIAGNLHVKLQKMKFDLEAAIAEESRTSSKSEEYTANIHQLCSENENARKEAVTLSKEVKELKKEAESSRLALAEAESNLHVALIEAADAKAAETKAVNDVRFLSEQTNAARTSASDVTGQITMSKEEYESLIRKVDESNSLADVKVAAALAQVEAVKASEWEALKRLEVAQLEIKDMDAATKEALKRAEMANAARQAIEGELRRWREREREREQKQAAAARSLENMNDSAQASPSRMNETNNLESKMGGLKVEIVPGPKKTLLPNLSGIFQRKRSHSNVSAGSPSYLPGEKSV